MKIDITFNVYTDANGGDPDSTSPTLRSYHKLLWSKPLPNGQTLNWTTKKAERIYITNLNLESLI
jgi:hypothetical protein